MSQSTEVLSTKSTNRNIDCNHYSNQFKRLVLVSVETVVLVSGDCFEKNSTAILQAILHNFNMIFKNDY